MRSTRTPKAEARHRQAGLLLPTLTTPRRVDLIDAEMEDDLAVMQRQGEAVKAFYALLTPSQQRTFDHQTKPKHPPGRNRRHAASTADQRPTPAAVAARLSR